jgi:eukaryotic-like serine/threonine-protein kinase
LVKVLDFGLAKQLVMKQAVAHAAERITETIVTDPGVVLGTTGYMSPEQVRGVLPDARSDLFRVGAMLYEMISGKRPFTGESGIEVMNAILKQDPPELDAALLPVLERMIRRCSERSRRSDFNQPWTLRLRWSRSPGHLR